MVEEVSKLGHYVSDEEDHHHGHDRNQKSGIHQRNRQLLAESLRQPLIRDVTAEHFFHVAALLPGQQSGRVDLWKHALGSESVRKQLPALYAFADVFQQLQKEFVTLALDEQIERGQDRQASLHQGQKLLIKDQEGRLLQLAAAHGHSAGGEQTAGLHPVHQASLLGVAGMDLR